MCAQGGVRSRCRGRRCDDRERLGPPILEPANIAYVGNAIFSPQDGASKVSFPFDAGAIGLVGASAAAYNAGCRKMGLIVLDFSTAKLAAKAAQNAFEALGGHVDTISIPLAGLPTYSAPVATMKSKGDNCAMLDFGPPDVTKFLQSNQASGSPLLPIFSALTIEGVLPPWVSRPTACSSRTTTTCRTRATRTPRPSRRG